MFLYFIMSETHNQMGDGQNIKELKEKIARIEEMKKGQEEKIASESDWVERTTQKEELEIINNNLEFNKRLLEKLEKDNQTSDTENYMVFSVEQIIAGSIRSGTFATTKKQAHKEIEQLSGVSPAGEIRLHKIVNEEFERRR